MKNLVLKTTLLASVAGMFGVQQSAVASEDTVKLDEIVVTARRRNESLQDVPATVSVLTSETLKYSGAKMVADFVRMTAGVSIVTGTTEPTDTSINIRGLNGARDAEGNVALVIDGVLRTSITAFSQPQGPLEQVEVLKGPQGAIYGRNASAGAIVITTKKPTDKLSGEVRGSGANDNTYSVSGLLSGPISEDLGFVLSAEYARSDGFYRNSFLPSAVNQEVYPGNSTNAASIDNYKRVDVFARLLFTPSDDSEIDIKGYYGNFRGGALTFNADFQIPALATAFGSPLFNENINDHKFIFTNNTESQSWQDYYGASIRAFKDLDVGMLTGYVSYNDVRNDYIAGGTSGAFGFFDNEPHCIASRAGTAGRVVNQEPFQTFSSAFGFAQPYAPNTCDGIQNNKRAQKDIVTELRLVSSEDGPLQWQIGASYIYIDRDLCINYSLDTGVGGTRQCFTTDPRFRTEALQDDNFKTNVYAVFGS
ncbi:MAG: TonB-dependent receptor plug domain-containing protein, partial [Rhodobacteraceae bacterium]|nr:TonB-dependent receptor plug domain-containing protein [Paracoccaceae bacterium]